MNRRKAAADLLLVRYVQSKKQSMIKRISLTEAKILESQWKQESQGDGRKGMKR